MTRLESAFGAATLLVLTVAGAASSQTLPSGTIVVPGDYPAIGNEESIGSDTTLYLLNGGAIGSSFNAGLPDGSSTDVEVNIIGGNIAPQFFANRGSTVNIYGGDFDDSHGDAFIAGRGSTVNLHDGTVNFSVVGVDAELNVSGGEATGFVYGVYGDLNVSGGSVGSFQLESDGDFPSLTSATVDVSGGEVGYITSFGQYSAHTVRVSGGSVAEVYASNFTDVEVTGGSVGPIDLVGGNIRISGGTVNGSLSTAKFGEAGSVSITGGEVDATVDIGRYGSFSLAGMLTNSTIAPGETAELQYQYCEGCGFTGFFDDGSAFDVVINARNSPYVFVTNTRLPGDYNYDGDVNTADYDQLVQDWGLTVATYNGADGNGDGVVNAADYTVLREALTVANAAAAVPEPTGASLLLMAFAAAGRPRR